jgi:integrase
VNLQLPPRMRARRQRSGRTWYYFDTGGTPRHEIPLGDDYVLAVQRWSELSLQDAPDLKTVGWAIARYLGSDDYTELAFGTQADYRFALDKLVEAFGDAPLDGVKSSHVTLYLDRRRKQSEHRAQRERSILSMIYRWAMARDWCKYNPVAAVRGRRLPGRRAIRISDEQLDAVYQHAGQPLRDALDLAYTLGQRPGDLLRMSETDIRDGILEFRQGKTGEPLRFAIVGQLADLLARIAERKRAFSVRSLALLVDEHGRRLTRAQLRARFEAARAAAGIDGAEFQFRDMRRKAGTDLREQQGLDAAQDLLGHRSQAMTEHYTAGAGKIRRKTPTRST